MINKEIHQVVFEVLLKVNPTKKKCVFSFHINFEWTLLPLDAIITPVDTLTINIEHRQVRQHLHLSVFGEKQIKYPG